MKFLAVLILCVSAAAQIISGPTTISGGVSAGVPRVTITSGNPPGGAIRLQYSFTFTANSGVLPYTWICQVSPSNPASCVLPTGLSLNPATGKLSGTPTVSGTFNFAVGARDASGGLDIRGYAIQIPIGSGPHLTNSTCPDANLGIPYTCQFTASGGTLPYAWGLFAGALPAGFTNVLPPGLSLNVTTGLVSGTPIILDGQGPGTYNFVIQVEDANLIPAQAATTIFIPNPPIPTITNANFPNGTVQTFYQFAQSAMGGTGALTWSTSLGTCASGGVLPTGLSLNTATGLVMGTPSAAGTFCFTENVTDINNQVDSQLYNVTISAQATQGAQLPTSWVNSLECNGTTSHTIAFPADGLAMHGGTPYANTQAGVNSAVADANTKRDADGTGTTITLPHNSPFSGILALKLIGSNSATGLASTNCLILDSDTPLPANQIACSHGVREGNRNPGCTNDAASMWAWSQTNSANPALDCNTAGSSGPAHHYLLKNFELRDDQSGPIQTNGIALGYCGTNNETSEAQQPNHMHFTQFYLHGYDTPDISALRGFFYSMHDSSFNFGYTDRIHGNAKEGQVFATQQSSRIKFDHVWCEGGSECFFVGGAPPAIAGYQPSDFQITGSHLTLDYGWEALSSCVIHTKNWVIKNRLEFKNIDRAVVAGDILSQSWCDGQSGYLMLWNVRALSTPCTNCTSGNSTKVTNVTAENIMLMHSAQGIQTDAGSGGTGNTGTSGFGQALKGQNWGIAQGLFYDMGDSTRYPGNTAGTGYTAVALQLGTSGQNLVCSAARDGAGAVATLTCAAQNNVPGTGMTTGDPVKVTSCTGDQGFLTGLSLPYVTATSASPSTLTVVYPNIGAASGTATNCILDNSAGYPNFVTVNHLSVFGASNATGIWFLTEGQSPNFQYPRHVTVANSIFAGNGGNPGGIAASAKAEGSATEQLLDTGTLHLNALVMTGRKCSSYTTYQPGELPPIACPGNNLGLGANQTGIICTGINPVTGCLGIVSGMNGAAYNSNPTDYHDLALRPDSWWARLHPGAASDGLSMGVDLFKLDAAIDSPLYTCATPCGSGPFNDGSEDMLDWWGIGYPTRTTNHNTGTLNTYTWQDADHVKLWRLKQTAGNPWDILLYDSKYVKFWITENGDEGAFANASAWKRYQTPVPITPRYFMLGTTVTIDTPGPINFANPITRTVSCEGDGEPVIYEGDIRGVTTGPTTVAWGGAVGTQPTLTVSYFYSGANGVYNSRERYSLVKNFGVVNWDHAVLSGGVYVVDQPASTETGLAAGGAPSPNWPCGIAFPWWVGGTPGAGGNSATH